MLETKDKFSLLMDLYARCFWHGHMQGDWRIHTLVLFIYLTFGDAERLQKKATGLEVNRALLQTLNM